MAKKIEKINQEEVISNQEDIVITEYHICDFVIRTKMSRVQQEINIKKYENEGLKPLTEWESITNTPVLEIFK